MPDVLRFYTSTEENAMNEDYCDYCEREGHTFNQCPARDDYDHDDES